MTPERVTDQLMSYEGQLVCPETGQGAPAFRCPFASECEPSRIPLKGASDYEEAQKMIELLDAAGQIPYCKRGFRYLTISFGYAIIIPRLADQ